jgi:hypothetical protein
LDMTRGCHKEYDRTSGGVMTFRRYTCCSEAAVICNRTLFHFLHQQHGGLNEFTGILESELLLDVSLVRLNGVDRDVEPFADRRRTHAAADQPVNLEFAVA